MALQGFDAQQIVGAEGLMETRARTVWADLLRKTAGVALAVVVWAAAAPAALADSAKRIRTTEDALADAATVIEGRVVDVSFTYDPVEGPRTVTTFADVQTHLGEVVGSQVRIATLGGPLPGRRILVIPELPEFRRDSIYIVVLTASDWFYSPVVANYAFRVERLGGREVLVTQTGHPIVGITRSGIETAALSVDPPGVNMRTRFDRPVLVVDATARAATALSKASFLGGLKELGRAAPPRGSFKPSIARSKVWDVTAVDRDPGPSAAAASDPPACGPGQAPGLACRTGQASSSKGGDQ